MGAIVLTAEDRNRSAIRFLSAALVLQSAFWFPNSAQAQGARESLAGERAAQALKKSVAEEEFNLRYGPIRYRTEAGLALIGDDNVFRTERGREADLIINPEAKVTGVWPVTEINALRLSLGLGYEWYLEHSELNSDVPLIHPDSELVFYIFTGDFRIRLRDQFSYQESVWIPNVEFGTPSAGGATAARPFINFNDVGKFARLDNVAGLAVDWDLNQLILSAGYDHENFISFTERFDYLTRASELFFGSASFLIGDKAKTGLEAEAGLHDYDEDIVLNDHWRARVGPFLDMNVFEGFTFRIGGGFDTARYDDPAFRDDNDSDYDTYYAYGRARQQTRFFAHSLSAGREHLLGDTANNLKTTYVRYYISSPIVRDVELGAVVSANFSEEFGGPFREDFEYYRAGIRVRYQFHKHWRGQLAYDFSLKDSELTLRDYHQNRASVGVVFHF